MTKTATFIRSIDPQGMPVDARLYRLSEPMVLRLFRSPEESSEYVVVSGSSIPNLRQPETYIFLANEEGQILNLYECAGSFQGSVDHKKALEGAGYTVVEENPHPLSIEGQHRYEEWRRKLTDTPEKKAEYDSVVAEMEDMYRSCNEPINGGPCWNVTCGSCLSLKCGVCQHDYADHYTANGVSYDGCAMCADCEGFGEPPYQGERCTECGLMDVGNGHPSHTPDCRATEGK